MDLKSLLIDRCGCSDEDAETIRNKFKGIVREMRKDPRRFNELKIACQYFPILLKKSNAPTIISQFSEGGTKPLIMVSEDEFRFQDCIKYADDDGGKVLVYDLENFLKKFGC